jgi:hypothetical protein
LLNLFGKGRWFIYSIAEVDSLWANSYLVLGVWFGSADAIIGV